jgi:hypothetical protein
VANAVRKARRCMAVFPCSVDRLLAGKCHRRSEADLNRLLGSVQSD